VKIKPAMKALYNFDQAAIARFQQKGKETRRPQSATATWKSHSNEPVGKPDTGVNVAQIRNEGL
jgi:hypothetical protein